MDEKSDYYIDEDGNKFWYLPSKGRHYWHRHDGPAIERVNGTKVWYVNGKRHRLDGPAHDGRDGSKAWYVDGKRHRLDGPAVEWVDGTKYWYWFVDDKRLPTEEVETWLSENNIDLTTQEGQMSFKLRWV